MRRAAVALAVLATLPAACLAAEEEDFFAELPLVASVSRLTQRMQDLPTSVTVLDQEIIKASGARDLSDLMRLVPGFQTFAHTTDPVRVTYHGITDEDFSPRVQVLVDGRSLYSPLFRSGVNWNLMPVALADIERIEVVRGTNSASYGTNAFMGVVNIVTVDAALTRGTTATVNHGNQGVRDFTLSSGGKLGAAGDLRLTYQQKADSALIDRADWSDAYRSRLVDIRADLQLGNRDQLRFRLGGADASMRMGLVAGPDQGGYPSHPFDQSSTYFQADWMHALGDRSDLSIRYAYTRDHAFDNFQGFSKDFNVYYSDGAFTGDSARQELEIQHTASPFHGLRLAWGAGYRHDAVRSTAMFYADATHARRVARQFGNLEWRPAPWFTGNLGASFDQDSVSGSSVSPRIATNFHLDAQNTIRLAAAKAVRSSALADYRGEKRFEAIRDALGNPIPPGTLYKYAYYGDPGLRQERLESMELGYLGDWRQLAMSLDVRWFREVIPNRHLLAERAVSQLGLCDALCPNSTADFVTEAQRVRIRGLEYQWRWRPSAATKLLLNQAYLKIQADYLDRYLGDPFVTAAYVSDSALARDRQLTENSAPRLASAVMLIQELSSGLTLALTGTRQGPMKWTRNTTAEGYTRIDARLGHTFKLGARRAELALTTQSINGGHGEFKASGRPDDKIVTRRAWLSLGISL